MGVELIGRLGIPQALGKLSVENDTQAPALEQTGLALSFLISAIVGALWLSAPAIAQTLQIPEGVALLRLAAIDIPFYGMYFTCDEILGGRRQFGAAAWGGVIYGAGKAAGIALLCGSGLSISGAFIVNIIASVAALLFMAKHVSLGAILPIGACLPVILRLAMPMGLIALGVQVLLNIDLWALRVLGRGLTDETTGWYVAAVNVAKLPTVASFVMTAILLPSISRALSRDDTALAQSYVQGGVRFLCVVLVPVCLLCTLTAKSLMGFLYSSRYAEGASFLRVLVFGFGLSFTFLNAFCAMLTASGRSLLAARITLTLIPLGVVCHILMIPSYGATGATIATTLTLTLGACTAGALVRKHMGPLMVPAGLLKVALATAVMVAVGTQLTLSGPMLFIGYVGLLSLYALVLMLLGELTREDLRPFALWLFPTAH